MPRWPERTVEQRFWEKVDKSGDCWIWTAADNGEGYGYFTVRAGEQVLAHRFSYETIIGPITEETLDHTCRNRRCVNPAHLEPVPEAENIRRAAQIHHHNRVKKSCPRGHPYDAVRKDGRRYCRACAREAHRRSEAKAKDSAGTVRTASLACA